VQDKFAICGLRRKRAYLAGEIEAAERDLARKRQALANIDAVILLFEPESHPDLIPARRATKRGLFFRHGEQQRLCLAALREANAPLPARRVAEYAMQVKELPIDNGRVRERIIHQVRVALTRLEEKGKVRRIVSQPDTWWELATQSVASQK
jgi:hypothetical protein